ncbi:MAG: GNAT family N-acetyltransferase [Geodermatophilales bacterium]|nr:GNAT family N-acetyltransferase [Geodermatophilales bacterium]
MLRTPTARVLDETDEAAVHRLLATDPVAACVLAGRVEVCGTAPSSLGAPLWGFGAGRELDAVCLAGANLIPFAVPGAERAAAAAFAERARRAGRRCSTIVGPAAAVAPLWDLLSPHWGPARDHRPHQPLMAIDGPVAVSPEPRVRPEAEIGAVSRAVCQVQGVWVAPAYRGRGIGTAGTAAVVEYARAAIAPVVSLYVNDFNAPARAAYRRVGFREVGRYASVLF